MTKLTALQSFISSTFMHSPTKMANRDFSHIRLEREYKTIKAMIKIYCRAKHESGAVLCTECNQLLNYARKRLLHCPFQQNKPTCGNCLVHCYRFDMRSKVIEVMRFSGPRMIYHHPLMALRHMLDSQRKPAKLLKMSDTKK